MLQNSMGRFVSAVLLSWGLGLCLAAAAQPAAPWARGVIVRLNTEPPAANPSANPAPGAEAIHRERLARVAASAGVPVRSQRAVGGRHRLLRFAQPLQGAALDAELRRLRLHPDVASVEPDVLIRRQAVPNDPLYAQQWPLQAPGPGRAAAINAETAWNRTTGGVGITVAVLDTGVRPHPELAGKLWPGYDFVTNETVGGVSTSGDGDGRDPDPTDPGDWVTVSEAAVLGCAAADSSWHGTFIAGQIAAATDNGAGVAGVHWGAKVLPVRVSGKCGAFLSDILDGMRWAAGLPVPGVPDNPHPAQVINLSFAGDAACGSSYQDAVNDASNAGALVVVAAGNESSQLGRPADCGRVLSVGAAQQDGLKAYYSNSGLTLSLLAPGGSALPQQTCGGPDAICSLDNAGLQGPGADTFGTKRGTSFAAPLAAGVAALMLSVNPALTPAQLVARMRAGVRAHTFDATQPMCSNSVSTNGVCNCTVDTCGAGLLDAEGATLLATAPAVRIAPVGSASPGGVVALDGRASVALAGAAITGYAWSQVSGPPVTLQNRNAAVASAVLPGAAGTFVFRLAVTDGLGRTGEDLVTVTSAASSVAGGGSSTWGWGLALWVLALGCVLFGNKKSLKST
jgi:serine protease